MASNVVRAFPASMPPQPSQQDWLWDGANWVWCGPPPCPQPPMPPACPPPFPCPPAGFPTPCPPWFPPPAAQAPWYPGANAGVSFSATEPVNPIRGNFWWDGTTLHMFDGAAWVTIGPATGGAVKGVIDGSSAPPGFVGEVIRQTSSGSLVVSSPPAAATNFAALVVPPGDWNIQGTATLTGLTNNVFWDFIIITLSNGATQIGAFQINGQFTATAGGLEGGTFSTAMIPLSVAASTTITCSLQVTAISGGPSGSGSYSFLCQGRRMR